MPEFNLSIRNGFDWVLWVGDIWRFLKGLKDAFGAVAADDDHDIDH